MKPLARTISALTLALLLATPMALPHAAAASPEGAVGVVNINEASADQLTLLPGIGRSKAQRIVAYRTKRKFRQTYEIVRVKGIGQRTFRHLKPLLTISGPTTLSKRPARRPKKS